MTHTPPMIDPELLAIVPPALARTPAPPAPPPPE
jgi:hypothetical protein